MKRLNLERLKDIARTHSIKYEILRPRSRRVIATRMSRTFNAPQRRMYEIVAKLEDHDKLLSHCNKATVVDKTGLEHIIPNNQFIVVSDVNEGGSKLAISRYTMSPPRRIDEDLMTDPFPAKGVRDRKDGKISWVFRRVGRGSCKMICQSEFEVATGKVFVRGLIDHVWMSFFENMMVEVGELRAEDMLTEPSIRRS